MEELALFLSHTEKAFHDEELRSCVPVPSFLLLCPLHSSSHSPGRREEHKAFTV
jgi:hypothetical protein